MSRPVSRILSWATIHLGRPLLNASCDLPADIGRAARQRRPEGPLGLAPGGVYLAAPVTRSAGELLPHRFTLTRTSEKAAGGLISVALSRTSPWVAVGHHRRSTESGLSSTPLRVPRPPGRLIRVFQSTVARHPLGSAYERE